MVRNLEQRGKSVKYEVISTLCHKYTVGELCTYLQVSRSGYYKYLQSKSKPHRNDEVKKMIRFVFQKRKGIYGYRRIQAELRRIFDIHINHKRVLRLMQEMGLQARIRRKYRYLYHNKSSSYRVSENLLNRKFKADHPNQKWVTDISFIHIGSQRLYLSAIMDLYNNEIVAYELSNRNDNQLVLNTIKRAVEKQKDVFGTILHSDRGYQYTSHAYHDTLHQFGVISSMSRKGNCYDNACIESFFSHLKTEALYIHNIQNVQEAQKLICEYIRFYNHERIQLKLNQLPPVEYRRQNAA